MFRSIKMMRWAILKEFKKDTGSGVSELICRKRKIDWRALVSHECGRQCSREFSSRGFNNNVTRPISTAVSLRLDTTVEYISLVRNHLFEHHSGGAGARKNTAGIMACFRHTSLAVTCTLSG